MEPKIVGVIALIVISGGGAFYGGMTYAQMSRGGSGGSNFTNLSPEERQARFAGGGAPAGMRGPGGMNGEFTIGEVISKDETSITIKMQDGSTKIILVGSSAQIMKSTTGSVADLTVGTEVTITGSANSDGSLTAQSVQIRPAGTMPFGNQPIRSQ